jgi:hypothetical protein
MNSRQLPPQYRQHKDSTDDTRKQMQNSGNGKMEDATVGRQMARRPFAQVSK